MIISQPLLPLCRAGRAEQLSVPPVPTRDHQEPRWDSLLHFSTPWHSLFQLPDQGLPFFRYGKAGLRPPTSLHHHSISFPSHSSASAPSRGLPQHRAGRCSVLCPCLAWGQRPWDRDPSVLPTFVGWVISTGVWGNFPRGIFLGILDSPTPLGSNRAGQDGRAQGLLREASHYMEKPFLAFN